ncbi:hypothetical protein [uncultured Mitsuokella sp.]|uniref:hypothetical protein n=1 Tax=uncultured Mitsuokella sp. TaxID=453120 RepID=UPI0026316509|nr:hypothetical protein [uncultured Mitsuokella sp.]
MKFHKLLSVLLSAVLLVSSMGITAAATPETVQDKLGAVEKDTYGTEQTGALIDRINKLEKDYDGTHRTGSMMARVNAIYNEVYTNSTEPSLLADLNAVEWNIGHEVSMDPVDTRVANLEMDLTGKTGTGTYRERLAKLSQASFGSAELPLSQVRVPSDTLVKIALVTPVNSNNLKVGDTIRYQVSQDVLVDGKLVFAKGLPGEGTVTKVKQARNFGRNAEVQIDFNKTKSIDGTYVDTYIGEEAKKEMKNLAMAAGASIAGIAILGPIGVVAGAFVHGKDVNLPAGTELFIQTKGDAVLYGVATTQVK